MWGPGPWGGPMWGFWWIFPIIGLAIGVVFLVAMVRAIGGRGGFMCMGGHHARDQGTAELRREIQELQDEIKKLKAAS